MKTVFRVIEETFIDKELGLYRMWHENSF